MRSTIPETPQNFLTNPSAAASRPSTVETLTGRTDTDKDGPLGLEKATGEAAPLDSHNGTIMFTAVTNRSSARFEQSFWANPIWSLFGAALPPTGTFPFRSHQEDGYLSQNRYRRLADRRHAGTSQPTGLVVRENEVPRRDRGTGFPFPFFPFLAAGGLRLFFGGLVLSPFLSFPFRFGV